MEDEEKIYWNIVRVEEVLPENCGFIAFRPGRFDCSTLYRPSSRASESNLLAGTCNRRIDR